MHYYIKNMVCDRCILIVGQCFEQLGHPPLGISLGEVETAFPLSPQRLAELENRLTGLGFELIDDTKTRLVEKIKNVIIGFIHHHDTPIKVNHSTYIESHLHKDYAYLSSLFSETEGITIEKYIIHQKIERVKELLTYHELSLSQIADQLGYASVAYLSGQFKKITGLTPTQFKQQRPPRTPLDRVGS